MNDKDFKEINDSIDKSGLGCFYLILIFILIIIFTYLN
jgi:hypothetical protein